MYTRRGARLTEGSNSWAFVINVLGTYFSNHLRIHSLRQGWHYRQDFWSEDRFYMRDFSKLNQELGNLSLCNWPFHPKPKDYLHQFLLQAQGWEFSYYSIASAYQCLHKLELSLFREGSLSTQIDIGHEDKVKPGLTAEHLPACILKAYHQAAATCLFSEDFLLVLLHSQ